MKGLGAKVLLLILSLSSISFSRANLACNGYVSPSTGESVASPLWGSAAAKQATSQTNATNPFFMCFTALATYTYPNNTKKGFAVFGGIPGGDQYWYNGVGGMLSGLYYQADLFQYVFDYCRNTLAGQVVTQALPASLLAPLPLNLDGGNGVNSTFPSLLSYYAGTDGFIAANPDPLSATVVAWCCASANCNMGTAPQPMPPMPPPQVQGKGAASFAVTLMTAPALLLLAAAINLAAALLLQ